MPDVSQPARIITEKPEMSIRSASMAYRYQWFRWLPRAVFLVTILAPILEVLFFYLVVMELGPKYWEFGRVPSIIFYLILAGVAWTFPIAGGILVIIAAPIMVTVTTWLAGWGGGLSEFGEKFILTESFLLVIGGILSIIWGILRKRGT